MGDPSPQLVPYAHQPLLPSVLHPGWLHLKRRGQLTTPLAPPQPGAATAHACSDVKLYLWKQIHDCKSVSPTSCKSALHSRFIISCKPPRDTHEQCTIMHPW